MSLVRLYVSLSKDFTIWHTDLVAYTWCRILNEVIWSLKRSKPVSSFIKAIQFVLVQRASDKDHLWMEIEILLFRKKNFSVYTLLSSVPPFPLPLNDSDSDVYIIPLVPLPTCASLNSSMQELTGVDRAKNEQHQEQSQSRMSRDWKDTFVLIQYLIDR